MRDCAVRSIGLTAWRLCARPSAVRKKAQRALGGSLFSYHREVNRMGASSVDRRNLQHHEVEALLAHVLSRAHALVDILQTADGHEHAVQAVATEFDITPELAGIVLDQQFRSLLRFRPQLERS